MQMSLGLGDPAHADYGFQLKQTDYSTGNITDASVNKVVFPMNSSRLKC